MLKDYIYNYLVRKNKYVQYEYEKYVIEHISEHKINRLGHWIILLKLNWHYRIRKKNEALIYSENQSFKFESRKNTNSNGEIERKTKEKQNTLGENGIKEPIQGNIVLKVAKIEDVKVSLEWNYVYGISKYIVQKYEKETNIFRQDGVTETNSFNVKKLQGDKKYKFRVIGVGASGNKIISNEVKVTTLYPLNLSEANPYMDGPESAVAKRRTVHFLAKELLSYDVISFDIFDTLIVRPFSKPRDLFMMLDAEFDMLGFANVRQKAELTVREQAEKKKGNREITIDDIYEEIERRTGINKEKGKGIELKLEYDLCEANPYMLRLFQLLKCAGKTIILVSDMYLPSNFLNKMLKKCGYSGYEEIFVSCEHNSNKYSGTLYRNVFNKVGKDLKYIHIGDNYKADIEKAKKEGMDTFYYKGCNDIGNIYRASQYGMQELIGSAYSGLVNVALHNGLNKFSVYYEYGYLYGGLYVYGFCQWIHRYAIQHQLDKVLFFARDGYIYKAVYDKLFTDIPSEYVFYSRISNSMMCAEKQRDNFLIRNIEVKASYELKTTIGNFFDIFELHFLDKELKKYGLALYHEISQTNQKVLVQFVIDHWDNIMLAMETNSSAYKEYVHQIIDGCKQVAVVDTGWQGTTLMGMKWLIEEKWHTGCDVHCLMAASQTANPIVNQTQLMKNDITVYMFSGNYNRYEYLFHKKTYKNNLTSYLFEIFTQAPHPTFHMIRRKDGKVEFQYGIPEVENYHIINEIHNGILDFCMQYAEKFKEYPYMQNISGHDAYIPFLFIAKNPRLYKQYFQDFAYSKSTGGDVNDQKMESIGKLFEEQGR